MSEVSLSIGRQCVGAFKNASVSKNAFKHSYTVECGNRLRVGARAKNAVACRGLRVGPSKGGYTLKNPSKTKKFNWTSLSKQFLQGSWLISQGSRQKFAHTFWTFLSKRGVFCMLSGVIRANRFARIGWFVRIGNSSDSCESARRGIKIGVPIANDSRESIRANRPCH